MRTALPPVIRARLKTCARQHPEWRSWLVLLQETLHGMDDPMWTTLELRPWGGRPARAPLLDGMELSIEKSPVQTWMRRLSVIAEREIGDRAVWSAAALNGIDVFALLAATIQQDFTRLQALAAAARASRQALQALARLAATPLLHACRHRLADALPPVWGRAIVHTAARGLHWRSCAGWSEHDTCGVDAVARHGARTGCAARFAAKPGMSGSPFLSWKRGAKHTP
jgi:hypothetical protein